MPIGQRLGLHLERGYEPLAAGTPKATRYIVVTAKSCRSPNSSATTKTSVGAAAGEGLHYRFVVANATGRIEYLEELVDGEWQVVAGPPPLYLATLAAVKMADERWKHDYGSAANTDPSPWLNAG